MRTLVLIICLVLSACAPDPMEAAYKARIAEAHADCVTKGGDEFRPYGASQWYAVINLGHPSRFVCVRFNRHWKTNLAVYVLRSDGKEGIALEIR